MTKGKHSERVGSSVKYAVTPDVVADATLQGLLKRKREVIVPKFYKWFIKLYQTSPSMVERAIRKRLKPTAQVMAEAAKQNQY
jgi:short-subunit dehydrogenase